MPDADPCGSSQPHIHVITAGGVRALLVDGRDTEEYGTSALTVLL
jgi:hypothetical protein